MGSLFPSLPDEIGLECLLRVKLNSHPKLRCVCKSWNAAFKSPHFYQERKRLNISEKRIFMVQTKGRTTAVIDDISNRVAVYNLENNCCKSLPPAPGPIYSIEHCHFVKQKLVLITDMFQDSTTICVWLYDFACCKWRQGATMLRWLEAYASAADEEGGLIYVGGGFDKSRKPVRSASVYNVEEDKWDVLPDMNALQVYTYSTFKGAFADGKFYVMGTRSAPSFEAFDSYTRSWKTVENRFNCWHSFVSAPFGRLYFLSDKGLIEYDCGQDKWNIVGPLPTKDWELDIQFAVMVGHNIFVCRFHPHQGRGYYMVEPPNETGGAINLFRIRKPRGLEGKPICAATLNV
ncbi:F-box/kelch-repeat protein At1g80440-like [Cryptomeria japonica]|uniref:F-box/kelch-repeat protein At1g80440-like n=1 Tax=Cryptomeria japonica TaxID=3369 RepID=UPI0027DA51D5|nr:F-box/kelch-repeat protein At1g80440-like [Cryptomeria japonica]XP_059073146.1 F-box/kelch-repeat protein At1g80440-like [Cryptomeria japonica]